MGQVSGLLAMDRTTLTANLKPLERRGLLKVSVDDADKRSRRLSLTPAGRAQLRLALPIWRRAQASAVLNPRERGESGHPGSRGDVGPSLSDN